MPYAIKRKQDNSPPQDGVEIGWRAVAESTKPENLEPFELLVTELPELYAEDMVWDAKAKRPRKKTEAERLRKP